MAITLPTEPVKAISDLTGNNILFVADYGMGKSGLLASTGYLLGDPEDKLKAYPDLYRVTLPDWKSHLEFRDAIAKAPPGTFKGIGLDSLNISYSHCLLWVMKNVRFNGTLLNHPSESPQIAYPRVTHEFITWLQSVTLLGYHVIGTCHASISEVKTRKGDIYNRWIPAFVGGKTESTYGQVLRVFPIVGFMSLEDVEKPAMAMKMGKAVPDIRADASRITEQKRVIHFAPSTAWLTNNKFSAFPDEIVLNDRWQDDWPTLLKAWGTGDSHEIAGEPIESNKLTAPAAMEAAGLS